MMKSVALFLFALCVSGILSQESKYRKPSSRVSSSFRYSTYTRSAKTHVFHHSTKAQVIISPSLPIKYKDTNYYWYGNYIYDASHPLKCEYPIDESDYEFKNVTYRDGSKPPSLQFGCLTYEDCCGLECCGDSRSSTLLVCGIFLGLLGLYTVFDKYKAYARMKRDSIPDGGNTSSSRPFRNPNVEIHSV